MPISSANHKTIDFSHLPHQKGPVGESGRISGGENSPRQADRSHSLGFSFAQQDTLSGHLALPLSEKIGKSHFDRA
jgi:hypothetical protein